MSDSRNAVFAACLVATWLMLSRAANAAETWADALSRMPLANPVVELNRTNCVQTMLGAFGSNGTVKALVFMPGATDELYMFRRVHAVLPKGTSSLLDVLQALTNQTFIRATFRPPALLLYTGEDALEPQVQIADSQTAERLKSGNSVNHLVANDRDWDSLQPQLRAALKLDLRPWRGSTGSWHFYRHSFIGWDLSGWEALECAAWAGKSRFTVYRKRVLFEPDARLATSVHFETKSTRQN